MINAITQMNLKPMLERERGRSHKEILTFSALLCEQM